MKPMYTLMAMAVAGVFVSGAAFAQTAASKNAAAVTQDKAQLKSDQSALERDKAQLKADVKAEAANDKAGKPSAQSRDDRAVSRSERNVQATKDVIAKDKPGSLQMASDKKALKREQTKLDAREKAAKSNEASGRMSSQSKDEMKVNASAEAVAGGKANVAAGQAKLKADLKK
jgi:hypothetical protein